MAMLKVYIMYRFHSHTAKYYAVIPRLKSDPVNEFFG